MRIVCPACAATYEVPEGRLLPGRVVRCARCDTDWSPVPDHEAAEAEPVAEALEPIPEFEPEPVPPDAFEPAVVPETPVVASSDRSTPASGTKQRLALRLAWAVSCLALVAVLWLGYSARDTVMRVWPPSIRAYAALGLTAHGAD